MVYRTGSLTLLLSRRRQAKKLISRVEQLSPRQMVRRRKQLQRGAKASKK